MIVAEQPRCYLCRVALTHGLMRDGRVCSDCWRLVTDDKATVHCAFEVPYGACSRIDIGDRRFCPEHTAVLCTKCESWSVGQCSRGDSFICGAPLCEKHIRRCPCHGG